MKVASGNVLWRQRKRNWCRTPFTFTVYTLTDRELSVKTGILNERFNLIKLFRIVDISVDASRKENGMSAREFLGGPGGREFGPGSDGLDVDGFDAGAYADGQ